MGRRGRNEETVYKRKDGRWEAKILVGYDPETGKPKRMSIYGETRKEVAEKLAQVLAEKAAGAFVEPIKLTFGEGGPVVTPAPTPSGTPSLPGCWSSASTQGGAEVPRPLPN